ncbi:MAG TPA: PAS-domain containing protein [Candidatus Udaeobacter sp.]|nr:PAS-domain containing protein [Candidatus Udaeobacter sp.]
MANGKQSGERADSVASADLRYLIEHMSEGLAVYDSADRLVLVSRLYAEYHAPLADLMHPGVDFEELLRAGAARGFYAEPSEDAPPFVERRLAAHRAAKGETILFAVSGDRWFKAQDHRMPGGGALVVHSEVTVHVHRERALHESEERLLSLAKNLPGLVFRRVRSPDGKTRYVYLSPRLKEMLGVAPEEVISGAVEIAELIVAEDRQRFADALETSAAKLSPIAIELRLLHRPDGALRWWQLHSTPRRRSDGTVLWDGIALDITDRKAAEERLHQALKMEAMGHLTGGIAHDFNNLLAIMLGNAELLAEREESGDPSRRAMLQHIVDAGERAAELTQRLLAFARRQPLAPRTVDLNALLEVMKPLLKGALGRGIEVALDLHPGLWRAEVDRDQVENAIMNLAFNARDAMPNGGRILIATGNQTIDAARAESFGGIRPGPYVELRISDNGTGMAPEVAARAIEPFFTTKAVGKGSGLGLSMIFGLAKQSGGHLSIDSALGKGTTVRLYLPKGKADAPDQPSGQLAAESVLPAGLSVLLVEDDAAVRNTVAGMISSLGYRVVTAPDGVAALSLLEAEQAPDLLMTDVVMPGGIDGLELARCARAQYPHLRVLLASGYNHGLNSGEQEPEPGIRLIGKPFRLSELAEELRRALGEA